MSDIPYRESQRTTVSGKEPTNDDSASVPNNAKRADGQYVDHWVLSAEELAKGFVRPVRYSYKHVGTAGPKYPLQDLTAQQKQMLGETDWIKYESYPPGSEGSALGRYWSQADLDKVGAGCGVITTMPAKCAETYAARPGYYGSTFCCGCNTYLPVGRDGEFVWLDGERVGT